MKVIWNQNTSNRMTIRLLCIPVYVQVLIGAGLFNVIQHGGTDFFRTGEIFTFSMNIATPVCFRTNECAEVISFRHELDVFSPGCDGALVGLQNGRKELCFHFACFHPRIKQ